MQSQIFIHNREYGKFSYINSTYKITSINNNQQKEAIMIIDIFTRKERKEGENGRRIINYNGQSFDTLAELIASLGGVEWKLYHAISEVSFFNIRYRDFLRDNGVDALAELLMDEAPVLKGNEKVVVRLKRDLESEGKLADYDIQCYNINDTFTVFGKEVHGLKDLLLHSEIYLDEHSFNPHAWFPKEPVDDWNGLHVGHMYHSYPRFDSYDDADDRTYQNYLIRTRPVSEEEMMELAESPSGMNCQRVHERIPEHLLPVLYYSGDGNKMLLATSK